MIPPSSRTSAFVLVVALVLTVGLGSLLGAIGTRSVEAEGEIELLGIAWDLTSRSALRILIVPNPSLPGWRDSYIGAVHDAIMEWMECIEAFQARYGYSYLSRFKFEAYVSGVNGTASTAYDITISWTSSSAATGVFGTTSTIADSRGRIQQATISLSLSTPVYGTIYQLSDVDMQNVAGDELGHALGVGHSNIRGDLMYLSFTFQKEPVCHSTLDVYGLAKAYQYLAAGSFVRPAKLAVTLAGTGIVYGPLRA